MSATSQSPSKREKRAKPKRLEARLTTEQKELLQLAAEIEGTTITDFVVRSAQTEARRIIEEHTRLRLSLEDSQAFVEALLHPPEPNARMMAAAAEYKQAIDLE
jgi:uncharacterized protein (DUF1778 family)